MLLAKKFDYRQKYGIVKLLYKMPETTQTQPTPIEPPSIGELTPAEKTLLKAMEQEQPWLLPGIETYMNKDIVGQWKSVQKDLHGIINGTSGKNAREVQEKVKQILDGTNVPQAAVANAVATMPNGVLKDYVFHLIDAAKPGFLRAVTPLAKQIKPQPMGIPTATTK